MITKRILALVVLSVMVFLAQTAKAQTETAEMFFGAPGARWEYSVRYSSGGTGTLVILNETDSSRMASGLIQVSMTFAGPGRQPRIEVLYQRVSSGFVLLQSTVSVNSRIVTKEKLEPPMLAREIPIKEGRWEYQGFKVTDKGRAPFSAVNTVRKVRVNVAAGVFDAFEMRGEDSAAEHSTEYWDNNVGLVKLVQTPRSGRTWSAELVSYSLSGSASQVVAQADSATSQVKSSVFKEDLSNKPQYDPSTNATFNLQAYGTAGGGQVNLCTGVSESEVVVSVRQEVDLSNQEKIRSLVERGKEYALVQCGSTSKEGKNIVVRLYQRPFSDQHDNRGNQFWVAYFKYVNQDGYTYHADQVSYHNVMGRTSQAVAQITPPAVQNTKDGKKLTRTIEGFTLGMSLKDAMPLLIKGFKEKRFEPSQEFSWEKFVGSAIDPHAQEKLVTKSGAFSTLQSFSTAEVREVSMEFYEDKLYKINVKFRASLSTIEGAFIQKYGPAKTALKETGYNPYIKVWEDAYTGIRFNTTMTGGGLVTYEDKAIARLKKEQAERQSKEAETEQKRKERTLPKNY